MMLDHATYVHIDTKVTGLRACWGLAVLLLLSCAGCLTEKHVSGTVTDFETDRPIEGATIRAAQHGWGLSNGNLVWDKDYSTYTTTDSAGSFTIGYRHGSSVNLWVEHQGYQRFQSWYPRSANVRIRLKQRIEGLKALPSGFLRLGQKTDGSYYGWDFATGRLAPTADDADIYPESVEPGSRGNMRLRASGAGGIRFVSREELGVDNLFLIYTDTAPLDGYESAAELDFASDGGIYFVRTRDGQHSAIGAAAASIFGWNIRATNGSNRGIRGMQPSASASSSESKA